MKKWLLFLCMGLVLTFGNTVHAESDEKAEELLEKCNTVMDSKKVISMEMFMESGGERALFMAASVDGNLQTSYAEMMGMKMYTDGKNGLTYVYSDADKLWYIVQSDEDEDSDADDLIDTDEMVVEGDDVDYINKGQNLYNNVLCEVVVAVTTDISGEQQERYYYINANTFELCGVVSEEEGIKVEVIYNYPDSIPIPDYVIVNAVLKPGSTFTYKEVTYEAVKFGRSVIVKVASAKKAAGSVSVPDKVSFLGKSYIVTEIGDNAFRDNAKIKKVTIGANVKKIGKSAFYNCKKLNQVVIKSKKVTTIGKKAFCKDAKKLKIKVPKSKCKKYKSLLKKSKSTSKYTVYN